MSIFQSGCAAILFASALLFAEGEPVLSREQVVPSEGSVSSEQAAPSEDSLSNGQAAPSEGSLSNEQVVLSEGSLSNEQPVPSEDSVSREQAVLNEQSAANESSVPQKTVLYLGGGAYSPWYSLGVLYAVRDYRIPVDSVVGTSWGVFIGTLWSQGFELDNIQRLITDTLFVSQLLSKDSTEKPLVNLPISKTGTPSLAFRYAFFGDSAGYAHFRAKDLDPDSAANSQALFRFQVQEALTRADSNVVPFTALACKEGKLVPSTVSASLPFSETSGENCPTFIPHDSAFALYVSAYPLRKSLSHDGVVTVAGFENALEQVRLQKEDSTRHLVVIRPHAVSEDSPLALMQLGYTDVEKKMGELAPLAKFAKDRPAPQDSILPRFTIEPSFESLPSASYSHVSAYWNEADTGLLAPSNFLKRIAESPFYDSVQINMDSVGIAKVSARTTPILEFRAGGLGSNLSGPLAYAGMNFRYVNQFEYAFTVDGYVGQYSYAVRPTLGIYGMFGGRGNVSVEGNISKREPLKGYFSDLAEELRILEVRENDLTLAFEYKDSIADILVSVLLGESEFKTSLSEEYGTLHVNSLIPQVSLVRSRGGFEEWFGSRGYRLQGIFGLRSVNLTSDGSGSAPLYFSSTLDAQKAFAPTDFFALGIGASGAVNVRRESGYGYEYPEELEVFPEVTDPAISNWFRLHAALSPWSEVWNFAEQSSHHYGAIRANAGLHQGIFGAWIFGAYMRDFEENLTVELDADRLLLEPMLRAAYRSVDVRVGMSRLVSMKNWGDFTHVKNYHYFFQVGVNW
ncbi:MAG: hypothetical protein K6A31_07115 [Fibrobacter sp.]|nr:hypothetical protein [Fibrobacter sp.]